LDELVTQALVIAFIVIMGDEILNSCPQPAFTEENEPLQAAFFDTAHKSLRVGVGMSLRMRRMATLKVDVSE
jgi:hypothetical protein